jgi:hypothetical protein
MKGFFGWLRVAVQLALGTVVVGIIVNLMSEEIRSDSEGWFHAITHSRLTPWLITALSLIAVVELLARRRTVAVEVPSIPRCAQKGYAPGYINSVEVVKVDVGTDLLTVSDTTISCHMTGGISGGRKLEWPYEVEAGHRIPNVRGGIVAVLTEKDPERFAARLDELKRYGILLRYEWEGVAGSTKRRKLTIQGDFESFKAHVIREWKNRGYSDLVYSAKGI